MAFDQPVIHWSSELASSIAANKAINEVEEYQKSYVCYASKGYICEAANLSTIRNHSPNAAPITARLDIVAAPAEYCLPIKKDRRFAPEFTIQVTLGTATAGDVTAKVLACPFSETHRRALTTPVQQRLPQFLVNEALGKEQPASEEDRQKWYLSFKGQTSVCLHFDSQRDAVPHTGGSQIVMQKRGTFSGLEYLKSSHMERVYLLFVMTLGDSPDIIATLFTVPTIVICRASQRRLATERLGYQLSVYDDLRTRGCSYNLPSRKSGGGSSPAATPCRSAAAAAAAVAAAAVGCANTTGTSSGGMALQPDGGAGHAAATSMVTEMATGPAALFGTNYAALLNGTSQGFPAVSDATKQQVAAALSMAQPGATSMNGINSIFDLAKHTNKPVHSDHTDGSAPAQPAQHTPGASVVDTGAPNSAGASPDKEETAAVDDDDEMTQDEEDTSETKSWTLVTGAAAAAKTPDSISRGVKRTLNAGPASSGGGNTSVTTAAAAAAAAAAVASQSPSDALNSGATNLAWLRVGQQRQMQSSPGDTSQLGVQEAHNLVSKLPRLSVGGDNASTAGQAAATTSTAVPIKVEQQNINSSMTPPASLQPLQALLALCSSQANKAQITQQLAAVTGAAGPAAADLKGSTQASNATAANIASAIRNATAANNAAAATSSMGIPAGCKASALDIQKLYQLQSKHGDAADACAGPTGAQVAAAMQRSPHSDPSKLAALDGSRPSNGSTLGHPNVTFTNGRFEVTVHEEVLLKSVMSPDVLTSISSGTVRLPSHFPEASVRRALEFLCSGKTALSPENALMTLAVGAHLEAPTLITYCFDYVIEWIHSTIGRLAHPMLGSSSAAVQQHAGDRTSWTAGDKAPTDNAAAAAVASMLPAAAALQSPAAALEAQQRARRSSTSQPAGSQPHVQALRDKPAEGFESVLQQYEPAPSTPMAQSGSASGAAAGPQGADAAVHMDLLLRLAQAQSTSGGADRCGTPVNGGSIAGLQAILNSNSKAREALPNSSNVKPSAADTAQMAVSAVYADTAAPASDLPAASAAAAAASAAAMNERRNIEEDTAARRVARSSNDGGSVPTTPASTVKLPVGSALDGSPSPHKSLSASALVTKGLGGFTRSPNCGASVAERRMHEQRAAEEERSRQLQLANESRELLAALLDSAQSTPEIMNNPQTAEIARHLIMSEQAARAAAGAAGQMIRGSSGFVVPSAAITPPHSNS